MIFLIGHFHFFCAAILVISLREMKNKIVTVAIIYAVPVFFRTFSAWVKTVKFTCMSSIFMEERVVSEQWYDEKVIRACRVQGRTPEE